jgi:hypothetical protein
MPIKQGYEQHQGERMGYYQWGDEGKKYYYTPGNETAREAAHASGYEE